MNNDTLINQLVAKELSDISFLADIKILIKKWLSK